MTNLAAAPDLKEVSCLEPGGKPRYEPVLAGPHLMGKFRRSVALG
jgi:hypothetical protein